MKIKFFVITVLITVLAFLPASVLAMAQEGLTQEEGKTVTAAAYAPVRPNITSTNVVNGEWKSEFRVFAVSKKDLGIPERNYIRDPENDNYVYYPHLTPELFKGATYYVMGTQKKWQGGKTVDYVDLSKALAKCTIGTDGYTEWCTFKDSYPGKNSLHPLVFIIDGLNTPNGPARAWGGHPDVNCKLPNKRGELQTTFIKYKNGVYCISDPALPDSVKEEARKQMAQSG